MNAIFTYLDNYNSLKEIKCFEHCIYLRKIQIFNDPTNSKNMQFLEVKNDTILKGLCHLKKDTIFRVLRQLKKV